LEGLANEEGPEVSLLIQHQEGQRFSSHRLSGEDQLLLPSYWTSEFVQLDDNNGEVEVEFVPKELSSFYLVDVTEEMKDDLEWVIEKLGGMSELVLVHRVENQNLWVDYCLNRSSMVQKYQQKEMPSVEVETTQKYMVKKFELNEGVNEVLVLHGVTSKTAAVVCHEGFGIRRVSPNVGKYGGGFYFCDDIGKADQYCDNDMYGLRHVFLSRVILGVPSSGGEEHDSVVAQRAPYNQFVVSDKQQCYPELLLTYFSGKKYCGLCE